MQCAALASVLWVFETIRSSCWIKALLYEMTTPSIEQMGKPIFGSICFYFGKLMLVNDVVQEIILEGSV